MHEVWYLGAMGSWNAVPELELENGGGFDTHTFSGFFGVKK